jgi:hypothetical protein
VAFIAPNKKKLHQRLKLKQGAPKTMLPDEKSEHLVFESYSLKTVRAKC